MHAAPTFGALGDRIIAHVLPPLEAYAALITLVLVQGHAVSTSRSFAPTANYTPDARLAQGAPTPSPSPVPRGRGRGPMRKPRRHWRTTVAVQERARELRQEMTPAERVLWRHLRSHRLGGPHFRRRHPIDRFIVDFCCVEHRLVVEVDGPIHKGRVEHDRHRTECLGRPNYRVIRFTNQDVLRGLPTVLSSIAASCGQEAPSLPPFRGGGGAPEARWGGGRTSVYVSPHLDDVVYSCGGRIWDQVRAGERPLVVTVFAGTPARDAPLSPFAQGLHARWGHPDDAAITRQEEDMAALALLGAEALHWPYTDCIYRQTPCDGFPYASEESLWGGIHPSDEELIGELALRLAALPMASSGTLYAPLGLGHHVDHRIVHQAARRSGRRLAYYEDFPYAEEEEELATAVAGRDWQAEVATLSEEALQAKIAAVACYRSQISTFWSGVEEMGERIRTFAECIGGGQPAERYWTTYRRGTPEKTT